MEILFAGTEILELTHMAKLVLEGLKIEEKVYITMAEGEELTSAMLNHKDKIFDILIINSQNGDVCNENWWGIKIIQMLYYKEQPAGKKPKIILMSPDKIPGHYEWRQDAIILGKVNTIQDARNLKHLLYRDCKSLSAINA